MLVDVAVADGDRIYSFQDSAVSCAWFDRKNRELHCALISYSVVKGSLVVAMRSHDRVHAAVLLPAAVVWVYFVS